MKPAQLEQFSNALLSAFPTPTELERLLMYRMGYKLEHITSSGPLPDMVFRVLRHAESRNELMALLENAYNYNSTNQQLKNFYESIKSEQSSAAPASRSRESAAAGRPVSLVLAYAPKDSEHARRLEKMLTPLVRAGRITPPWSTANIVAGQVTKIEIERHYAAADIIVILVSADLLADCADLLARAQRRMAEGATIIPAVVRPAMLAYTWLEPLAAYPRDSQDRIKPITTWSNQDEAWLSVIDGLQAAITPR